MSVRGRSALVLVGALVLSAGLGAAVRALPDRGAGASEAALKASAAPTGKVVLKKVGRSARNANLETAREAALKIKLFTEGPISIYGKCFGENSDPSNPGMRAEVYVKTQKAGGIFSADDGSTNNGFFGPGTAETNRTLVSESSYAGSGNPGTLNISDADSGNIYIAVKDTVVLGQLFVATKVGNPDAGNGVFGKPGDRCIFGGTFTTQR